MGWIGGGAVGEDGLAGLGPTPDPQADKASRDTAARHRAFGKEFTRSSPDQHLRRAGEKPLSEAAVDRRMKRKGDAGGPSSCRFSRPTTVCPAC